jgi:2-oxoglutarate dehydrogenase E2 component (dihydrolipoamide succinyltransferase)
MKTEMLMPQMGESIAEATVSKWLKKVGDSVKKDEIILEISTDKVDSEIPSPASGVITEILFKEGDVVPVKVKIATIDTDGAGAVSSASPTAPAPVASAPAVVASSSTSVATSTNNPSTENLSSEKGSRFYSPLVMSLAQKHSVSLTELETILGSGQGGRVNKQDLLSYVENRTAPRAASSAQQSAPVAASPQSTPAVAKPATPSIDWEADGSKVVVMDNMRQLIADHMVRSKHTSPHVYSVQEVDVTAISKWRAKNKNKFAEKHGFNLSFTPFFLEACVNALQQFPYVNSSVDGKKIILKKNVNLGCAVALGNTGLIVPVIKKAEEKNFVGLARGLNDLAARARDKKLLPDDIQGGTFTVTNPGVFGTIIGTPIINQPQSAILCLGAIKKRPVVIDDMIAIREICYLTLSYDHRIIDGSLGGQFLAFIRDYLEGWDQNRSI